MTQIKGESTKRQVYDFSGTVFSEWPVGGDNFTMWRNYQTERKAIIGFVTTDKTDGSIRYEMLKKTKISPQEAMAVAQFMRWLSRGKQL